MPEFHPIKRVTQQSRDFLKDKAVSRGGGGKQFLSDEELELHRVVLVNEIKNIEVSMQDGFTEFPNTPAVIKAKLRNDAIAKSHRPKDILDVDTCPIIGVDSLGYLLLSASKRGLKKLEEKVQSISTKNGKNNISTLEKVQEFSKNDRLSNLTSSQLYEKSLQGDKAVLKAILFDHLDENINKVVHDDFFSWVEGLDLEIEDIAGLRNLHIYRISGATTDDVEKISNHPALRVLSFFPLYHLITPQDLLVNSEEFEILLPDPTVDYPVVGVIDSGIPANHPFLGVWVQEHKSLVPQEFSDMRHGSFVGGLIVMAQNINGRAVCPDSDLMKVVDLQVLPREDPTDTSNTLTEDKLVKCLKENLPDLTTRHGVRIWNMSASAEEECDQNRFSTLGAFLDSLQDELNVTFVLPSGNYKGTNQRTWPPVNGYTGDYIQKPADSVRAVTVGAIACAEVLDSIVKLNEPASYSRRGLGPGYISKPEVVHYSGNASLRNNILISSGQGIRSFTPEGHLTEGAGTSYSCPLVARTLGLLQRKILPEPSPWFLKALLIHNSDLPKDLGPTEKVLPYVGYGMPSSIDQMLNCSDHQMTLTFDQELGDSKKFLEYPFVWPQCLKDSNGKCRGNVKMTLVSNVPLDRNSGAEYVRCNLVASLQAKKSSVTDESEWVNKLCEDPDPADMSEMYEEEIIKHQFKWKPVKRYEKNFKAVQVDEWRIKVSMVLRDGVDLNSQPVKFALIVTISDPANSAPVYREVVNLLQNKITTEDIQIRTPVRVRT